MKWFVVTDFVKENGQPIIEEVVADYAETGRGGTLVFTNAVESNLGVGTLGRMVKMYAAHAWQAVAPSDEQGT